MTPATCRNCEAPLTGPYCAQCGQHAHQSARALGALLHDAWHVITHVDGRLWSTLWLLLVRPGQLTLEYFAEHRARYVPPVRLYLVISIVFFALFSLTSGSRPAAVATGSGDRTAAATDAAAKPDAASEGGEIDIDVKQCDELHSSWRAIEPGLRDACRRTLGDKGRTAKHAFMANVPKMMFVFLPLIALVMRLLYWSPRRYYVEHLVFFLHNHAALFLVMALNMLFGVAARALPVLGRAEPLATFGVMCYAGWYVYRSMRRCYGQGRALTVAKLALVGIAYLVFLGITLLGTFVVSALTA